MQRGNMVGNYTCPWSPPPARYYNILGDIPTSNETATCNKGPWNRTSSGARWIGLNVYGQHTNISKWLDPSSTVTSAGDRVLDYGKIYGCKNQV